MQSLTEIARLLQRLPDASGFLWANAQERSIKFSNLTKFKHTLSILAQVDAYEFEIDLLLKSPLYQTTADELIVLNVNGAHDIYKRAQFLQDSVVALKQLMPRILTEEPQECVYIKFPDSENVSSITRDIELVEKATMQIVGHGEINGSFKVVRWESGSLWIHVFVGSIAAVTIVAGAAWSAAVVAKKWMEVKIFMKHAEGLAIKNESLEDLKEGQKKLLDELIYSESRALAERHFDINKDPEIVERVRFTISTFSELIERGGEVAPALNAPESVENLFPDYKALPTIQSLIPRIEDK